MPQDIHAATRAGLSSDRLDRIGRVLGADAAAGKIPGAVALVARDGRTAYLEAVGARDPQAGAAMTVDAIFRIYSMTKPITSLAIMMLVEEGRLLLSDPAATFLPAFAGLEVAVERPDGGLDRVKARRQMTVQDLLRHTSGLTYGHSDDTAVKRAYREAEVGRRDESNARLVEKLALLPLAHQPGAVFDYSVSTDVLGRIVEVVSGQTLDRFFADRILGPLGMADTGFDVPAEDHGRIAQPGPDPETGDVPFMNDVTRPAAYKSGGGGMVSTAADYLRFCSLMLAGGTLDGVRLVSPKTVQLMTADHLGTIAEGPNYLPWQGYGFGLGFAVRRAAGLAPVPGSAGDYYWSGVGGTYFWIDPAERLIAILMLQAPNQRMHYRTLFRSLVYQAVEA